MEIRRQIVAGNWKMHKNVSETRDLVIKIRNGLESFEPKCEVIVAPPFNSLLTATEAAEGSIIRVAAQNLYWKDEGAFTGEVSGRMIADVGCNYVIVGHSERRQYFGETDGSVNSRMQAALRNNLVPIFCIGETIEEREGGRTFHVVKEQLVKGLEGITISQSSRLIVAYEPVWCIGTGRTANPEMAEEVHRFIRSELQDILGGQVADSVRILYGGSVKSSNADDLLLCENIDGALVGGASLDADEFLGIIKAAK
jgi:triosephosphate isomerase